MNVQLEDICGKREAILNSTLSLIRKNGFHGTPMSQIAREAGVAAGTIYHYFDSKESLIHALHVHETTKLADALLRGDDEALPYKQRFVQCMVNHYNYYLENEDSLYFLEQFSHSPYANKMTEFGQENRFEAVSLFFEFGKRNNHIKNIDTRLLAPTIKGTLAVAANFQLSQHMDFTREDIMEVINVIWDGIKKQ